ncbi:MAG: cytochrome bc complex cytochrome b subunit [Candidatus Melainabacteria bacterium]|nr:MAG: cytochrome bc complex cytochrome b subunit [Candidatus Melainabacteria bacterium]
MTSSNLPTNKIGNWLEERLKLSALTQIAQKKEVPLHKHSIWYYMGGIAMLFLAVQFVTGILLMVYYVPDLESAHASILKINSQIQFGWFIRSLHSWGANLMIAVVFLHLFSSYFMKAYRKPREITWLIGMLLLVITMAFGFSGYLLPWDDISFFATKIGLDIASKTPLIGPTLAELLRGGENIGQSTISRFFVIHVAILPLVLLGLLAGHLVLVQMHGMSKPPGIDTPEKPCPKEKFFPNFFLRDLLVWILSFNVLAVLVTLAPWGIGPEADPFAPAPLGIKPEWYFLSMFQFLKLMPASVGPIEGELVGIFLIAAVAGALVMVPFWDDGKSEGRSALATMYGLAVLIGFIAFTIWGAIS